MLKICCIGTHSAGKSTLCYQQAAYYKLNMGNVKLIHEIETCCPFPSNHQFNAYTAMWMVHTHIQKELEAIYKNADLIICDRSPIDTIMQAQASGCIIGHLMKNLYKMADDWMDTYDKIYYVRPDGTDEVPEGIRLNDESFTKKMENCFDDWMEKCNMAVQNKIVILKSSQVFANTNCWLKEKIA